MSYSFNIKGKFKIENELVKDVVDMLNDLSITYERPKRSIFEIDDEGVLKEDELSSFISIFEDIFTFVITDIEQTIFLYIHELDPVDRELILNNENIDVMSQSDSSSSIIFIDKVKMKNTKYVIDKIENTKDDIISALKEKNIISKWTELTVVDNPFILQTQFKIKIKEGKGIFISVLLDEDLACENQYEVYQIKNKQLKKKFNEGYMGIRVVTRALSSEIDEKACEIVFEILKEKFEYFHYVEKL